MLSAPLDVVETEADEGGLPDVLLDSGCELWVPEIVELMV